MEVEASPSPRRSASDMRAEATLVRSSLTRLLTSAHSTPASSLSLLDRGALIEKIKRLEAQLVVANRSEEASRQRVSVVQKELSELERIVACKESSTVRRNELSDELQQKLYQERAYAQKMAVECDHVRQSASLEVAEHALQLQRSQCDVATLKEQVASLDALCCDLRSQAESATRDAERWRTIASEAQQMALQDRDSDQRFVDTFVLQERTAASLRYLMFQDMLQQESHHQKQLSSTPHEMTTAPLLPSSSSSSSSSHFSEHATTQAYLLMLDENRHLLDANNKLQERLAALTEQLSTTSNDKEILKRQLDVTSTVSDSKSQMLEARDELVCELQLSLTNSRRQLDEVTHERDALRVKMLSSPPGGYQSKRNASQQTNVDTKTVDEWEWRSFHFSELEEVLAVERIKSAGKLRAAEIKLAALTELTEKQANTNDAEGETITEGGASSISVSGVQHSRDNVQEQREIVLALQLDLKKKNRSIELLSQSLEQANTRALRLEATLNTLRQASATKRGSDDASTTATTSENTKATPLFVAITESHIAELQSQIQSLHSRIALITADNKSKEDALEAELHECHDALTQALSAKETAESTVVDLRLQLAARAEIEAVTASSATVENERIDMHHVAEETSERELELLICRLRALVAAAAVNNTNTTSSSSEGWSTTLCPAEQFIAPLPSSLEGDDSSLFDEGSDGAQLVQRLTHIIRTLRGEGQTWRQGCVVLLKRHAQLWEWLHQPSIASQCSAAAGGATRSSFSSQASNVALSGDGGNNMMPTAPAPSSTLEQAWQSVLAGSGDDVDGGLKEDESGGVEGDRVRRDSLGGGGGGFSFTAVSSRGTILSSCEPSHSVFDREIPYTGEGAGFDVSPLRPSRSVGAATAAATTSSNEMMNTALSLADTFHIVDAQLPRISSSLEYQRSELVHLRKSMYDVKSAFLAEMEAREELELQVKEQVMMQEDRYQTKGATTTTTTTTTTQPQTWSDSILSLE